MLSETLLKSIFRLEKVQLLLKFSIGTLQSGICSGNITFCFTHESNIKFSEYVGEKIQIKNVLS